MKRVILLVLNIVLIMTNLKSQENLSFQTPPSEILQLADFERAPLVRMDQKQHYMLLIYRNTYKTLDDLNQTEISLAGLRVNPVTNISSTITYNSNLKIQHLKSGLLEQVKGLPQYARIANISWSPDERMIAFTITADDGVELWLLDVSNAQARKITDARLNANLGNPAIWYADSKKLLVRMLPRERAEIVDHKKVLPVGPTVTVSDGTQSQNRTYQDLLKNKSDEDNFVSLTTSELMTVDLNGDKTLFKPADMYFGESFSPDGTLLLISKFRKPFSYLVPLNRFPQETAVYKLNGELVTRVNEVPLAEIMPKGFMAVRKGKRAMNWRPDKGATLFFVEALDEGDPQQKVDFRDAVYQWEAPFDNTPALLAKTTLRYADIVWGNDQTAVLHEQWYDNRRIITSLFSPGSPAVAPKPIFDRNFQDVYSDPGNFETRKNEFGLYVLTINNNNLFLIGDGFTEKGQFPFVDALDLNTLKTKRLYQSAYTDKMEEIIDLTDVSNGEVLVRIQSKNEYPNYYIRNFKKRIAPKQLTRFPNPFESISNVHKELIKYKREDGVELSGTLYLPVGYDKTKKEKKPLLIWAYPAEYKDKNSAGQTSNNPNEFTFPHYGSFVYWVTRGYVVLDDAAFPIVGEGEEEPNDTFVEQLVANAKAAIDAVDALGYIDRKKVAVGGHSYGAFMTANLLTHSDLFACGIARSGAYNRTLTPFGFQREQRNFWDAPEVYNRMSPFMNADKMKTPMLLVHGEADNNPGTFTLQTERYFQALKGLGAPARMVILPKESHGYVARENILHLLWEQDQFLEKYLK